MSEPVKIRTRLVRESSRADVPRIQAALLAAGYEATDEQCIALWRERSRRHTCAWLPAEQYSAEEIVAMLRALFEVAPS